MYQFIHIELYAESLSKKAVTRRTKENKKGKQNSGTKSLLNVRQVIAEAKRENGAYPHVANPQKPIALYGISLDEVENLALKSKIGQVDSKGRKLRNDTPILLAGIASFPRNEFEISDTKFENWLNDNVVWLKKTFGLNLKNVTLHLDEEHPHLHFFATSHNGRAKDIHPGYQAEGLVKDQSNSKEKKLAYTKAMQNFQDQYHSDVALKHGMVRIGAKKLRKSRADYNAEKANAKLLAKKIIEVDLIEKNALESAKQQSELIFKDTNIQIEKMKSNARLEIKRKNDEALLWTRKHLENMQKLAQAEATVIKLDKELKITKEELQYFVEENNDLRRKLNTFRTRGMSHD